MQEPFAGLTGRDVKVAIIDSGVNPSHPHVGAISGGVRIGPGNDKSYLDYNGHGTAVAGAIRERAPEALLFAVKVFEGRLTTRIDAVVDAIAWAVEHNMDVINLSLATSNEAHFEVLNRAVNLTAAKQIVIVSAHDSTGQPLLPGSLPAVIGVEADALCPRITYKTRWLAERTSFVASPYPRSIPGVPADQNLNGASFAVANMTGFVARAREMEPHISPAALSQLLAANSY